MKLIQEMDRAIRTETDPVKKAIAEMGGVPAGRDTSELVDFLADRLGDEIRDMDHEDAMELIFGALENTPGYEYGDDAESIAMAVLSKV